MKIAVSSSGGSLSAQVSEKFGRAQYFLIVDSETMKFDVAPNPYIGELSGVGPHTASLIAKYGAEIVLTGTCGPNAKTALESAGIKVVTGVSGTIQEAVKGYSGK